MTTTSLTTEQLILLDNGIRGPHEMIVRVLVADDPATGWLGASLTGWREPKFQVVDGSVTENLTDEVVRSLTLTVVSEYWQSPLDAVKDLSPYRTVLRVDRGVMTPTGPLYVELGTYRVESIKLATSSSEGSYKLDVEAYSRATDVKLARFESQPQGTGGSVLSHIESLTTEVFQHPASVPLNSTQIPAGHPARTRTIPVGTITTERDRLPLIKNLERDAGIWSRFDRSNVFRSTPAPTLADPPKWVADVGADGILISYDKVYDRAGIYNAVIVTGENRETGETWRAVARDTNPTSHTRYGGPFGKVPRFYYSPLIRSTAQAQATADTMLANSLSKKSGINFSTVPNPAYEVGDVIDLKLETGVTERHLITELSISLNASNALTARTYADSTTQEESGDM